MFREHGVVWASLPAVSIGGMSTHESLLYSDGAFEFVQEQIAGFRHNAEANVRGAKYAAFYSPAAGRMEYAPIELILSSPFGHALDYGSGVFEGSSAVVNDRTGIPCVILQDARMNRLFHRSLPARNYFPAVSRKEFEQSILDVVAIHGLELFQNPDPAGKQTYVRAYIRPSIHPKPLGGYGISLRDHYPIEAVVVAFTWPDYLDPNVYSQGGVAAITGHQRLFPITGKHASNYGSASTEGMLARSLGASELIYLAPYLVDDNGFQFWADPNDTDLQLRWGTLADGPGEEIIGLTKDAKMLVYPSMKVNRLGGTVLNYITQYMAPKLDFGVVEADITLADLRAGKYAAIGMVGNAVKVAPIREIRVYRRGKQLDSIVLFERGNIPEPFLAIQGRWNDEISGRVDASHPSLLTPVDLRYGSQLKDMVNSRFYLTDQLKTGSIVTEA